MSVDAVLKKIREEDVKFVDLRFTDSRGTEHHITYAADKIDKSTFEEGKMFDGSSIEGWKSIEDADMMLGLDPETAVMDPFMDDKTLAIRCGVYNPSDKTPYDRDPRTIAKRTEEYFKAQGIADTTLVGPEPEFFILDHVRWENNMNSCSYEIDSEEGIWNSGRDYEEGNYGHRPKIKGGYLPLPPVDSLQNLRSTILTTLREVGLDPELHHHEVGTAGQVEIGTRFNTLVRKADEMQLLKYVVRNLAMEHGKTATFMPKPLVGDNGSGMHVHLSLAKKGANLFFGDGHAGLSQMALHAIGGILKHGCALNAFTNASTNSYKRLVPGYEAPIALAYSPFNRSAAIRIPSSPDKGRRIEVRFPDSSGNPYLTFSALMMAALDGINNKIDPGKPTHKNLFDLSPTEEARTKKICGSLEEALDALDNNRGFLKAGGVFTDDAIDAYLSLKHEEVTRLKLATHPVEFDMYYSC